MRRKGGTQMSLDLPTPATKMLGEVHERSMRTALPGATVYSFPEAKAARDKSEAAQHFSEILQLVSHFK
jgi:hypothetical protein